MVAVSVCDNAVVGALVFNDAGRLLLIERAGWPKGFAPPAGHVDQHGMPEDAARTEVAEETGLTVVRLSPVLREWRPGVCGSRSEPGPQGWGHAWTVFSAEVTGAPAPTAEARSVGWYGRAELQALADRTVRYAHGLIRADVFADHPGLEPVWLRWLADPAVGLIEMPADDMAAVERLVADPHAKV